MPLITDRNAVLNIYARAAERGWVVPTFCAENLTTMEAILAAAKDYADRIGIPDIPVAIAITNLYSHRSQTLNYTLIGDWRIGLKLWMADLRVLTDYDSPFAKLSVMSHLDHVQPDLDAELLKWDLRSFSSIMFDASALPFDENINITARFVEEHGSEIVVEGACDEIVDAGGNEVSNLTTPENAERYMHETGVDFIVANLGTEHRASAKDLEYHGDLARQIKERVGPKIVLHGTSSVTNDQVRNLFSDGVCKVNIWTALERDSAPVLLEDLVINAAKVAGPRVASRLFEEGYLGPMADRESPSNLGYFTTVHRQGIVFEEMKKIVAGYLEMWYV